MNFRKLFLIIVLIITSAAAQDSVLQTESDLSQAIAKSAQANKPIFAMVYADWCPHCEKMKKETLADPEVIKYYNDHFVNLMVNADLDSGKNFMRRFNISTFPQFLYITPTGQLLYKLNGVYNVKEFLVESSNALDPKLQLPFLEKQFLEDIGSTEKCLEYINVLKKGKDRDQIERAAKLYLEKKDLDDTVNDQDWKIIAAGVNDFNSREFQYLIAHQKEFAQVISVRRVENKILNVITMMQRDPIEKLNEIDYERNRNLATSLKIARADSLIFRHDLRFYPKVKNWDKYVATTKHSVPRFLTKDANTLNEITTTYFAEVSDRKDLEAALEWAEMSNSLNETHETNFIIAKLNRKLNNNKEALEYAIRSRDIIEQMGWDKKKVDEFIDALDK